MGDNIMNAPEFFEMHEGYSSYRPCRHLSMQEAIELCASILIFARGHKIRHLLLDTTRLTGFDSPGTWERFVIGNRCAQAAQGIVKVALLARPEMIDPQHFGMTVARNRGLDGEVFSAEPDALVWLLDKPSA